MPLKDLVANKAQVSESVIEAIVSKYVRYYTDTLEIGFTHDGAGLSNEKKILVYLVALLGWRYVTDNAPEFSTKPADLEERLGIPGGTLRPTLKSLKDDHLIASGTVGYSVREGNLDAIAAAISGERKRTQRKVSKPFAPQREGRGGGKKARRSAGSPVSSSIDTWIDSNFFKSPRSLRAVHERLHEHGVIAPQTSVSGPLLKAVQQRRLRRQRAVENGKEVWVYCVSGR